VILRLITSFLSLVLITGCTQKQSEISIPFALEFGGQPILCGPAESATVLSDMRFYVSDLEVMTEEGESAGIALVPDGAWQHEDIALLDFEDGTDSCDNGTTEVNSTIHARLAQGDYRGLRFTVGVPFDRNHGDPLLAQPPLDDSAMHWHWRAGYKFLRGGVRSADDSFWIHLGSTGCQGTVGNISACSKPNRVVVELPGFVPGRDAVVVSLSALTEGADLGDTIASDCSSGPSEEACAAPFAALGLQFDGNGEPATQTVFGRREIE